MMASARRALQTAPGRAITAQLARCRKELPWPMPASSDLPPLRRPAKGVLVVFCDEGLKLGPAARKALAPAGDLVQRAAAADHFTGKSGSALDIVAPAGLPVAAAGGDRGRQGRQAQGAGFRQARRRRHGQGSGVGERGHDLRRAAGGAMKPDQAADLALGAQLRAYAFDRYKTKRKEGEEPPAKPQVTIAVAQCRRRRRRPGRRARGGRRGRDHGARSRQRAGQRALSGGIRAPRRRAEEARRRGRGARRAGDEEARHERAARRRAGLAQGQPRRDHALERRQEGRRRRSPSSARACASTPAASRSSRRPAWRT